MKLVIVIFSFIFFICIRLICIAQTETDTQHGANGVGWSGGNGKVCNVCHQPYNAKNLLSPTPYYNHPVNATTFRGNKLDGAPVLIRLNNGGDKCQNCHSSMPSYNVKDTIY